MKRPLAITILSLLGMSLLSHAANILWVSDNGPERQTVDGNTIDGIFYPAVSAGVPFVDQGFVDLLLNAGHQVTRYNPDPQGFQDSQADIPAINTYDLIILGSALNSGPYNLAARGPYWNTAITKPMIITKSTLIRRDRMGYLLSNIEFDCAADASITSSGKLTLLYPDNPIFCGIGHTNSGSGEVMNNFSLIRVPAPPNNRGTSVQAFSLLVNSVDQGISNAVEIGGIVLATIDFNPLDPGVNIPSGQAPAVDGTYQAGGYAIVEWPAGTLVRSTQVGGEMIASYRMLFACGTRDASGTATGAPNPLVGALDLTPDGQKMFLNTVGRALSQPLALSSTWGQYDLNETVNGAPGILALTNESATGFTAAIGENTLDVDGNAGVDQPGRPRIFQTFNPQALSRIGQRATLKFKIKFNNVPIVGDTQFRFGFADTAHNQAVLTMIDIGATDGASTWRLRPDISITSSGTGAYSGSSLIRQYTSGEWGEFGNTGRADFIIDATGTRVPLVDPATNATWVQPRFQQGGTFGGLGGVPNGIGLEDTTTTHSFEMTLERVSTGITWSFIWGNDAGVGTVTGSTSLVVDDSYLPMNSVDGIGFMILNNAPFGAATTGSFDISEVSVTAEGGSGSALPFKITQNSLSGGNEILTWNSVPCTSYSVEGTTDLANPTVWTHLTGPTVADGYTMSVTIPGQINRPRRFFRIRRD